MKTKILIIVLMFCSHLLLAQDVIIKKTGDEIKATVTEVTSLEIKYKTTTNPNVTYSILKDEVFMIQYQNGTKDVFTATTTVTAPTTTTPTPITTNTVLGEAISPTTNSQTDCNQAKIDAKATYRANGAIWGTYATAGLGSPIWGLIPAIACSSTKPQMSRLKIPPAYANNETYKNCFQEKAWKMKKGQTWTGYGLGCGLFIALTTIILVSAVSASY